MGAKAIELKLPTDYHEDDLRRKIARELHISEFTYQIENKSLDARNKNRISWLLKVVVSSAEIGETGPASPEELIIPYKKRKRKVVVTGSGPAGFFAAFVLQKAGFETIILERGADVSRRAAGITTFETTGVFNPVANYSFGEGGAGTFSDGKLTSRSKHISPERRFILRSYVEQGAPDEILYMAHPHLGSDNLKVIVQNLRTAYQELGGRMLFETSMDGLVSGKGHISAMTAGIDEFPADEFIIAPGHSSYETYRMLIKEGVHFRTKNFAIGSRVEHEQVIINKAQWGVEALPGVKAAEYRLTSHGDNTHPVYSFCMCPGGMVVPAASYAHINIVNGMSNYQRNARFANAGCVAGIHPDDLAGREVSPLEALQGLEDLENSFFEYSGSHKAPFCTISGFLEQKISSKMPETSYPLGLIPAPLWEMLPAPVVNSMRKGLEDFIRKVKGYDRGIMLGLESKTSSPVQVIREDGGLCSGFDNLYLCGEGSGYAGGIISSAADGIRTAMKIIRQSE